MKYLDKRMGLFAVLLVVGCSGPMGPIPGGMLKGDQGTVRGAEEPSERAWVRHAAANPMVRIRIDGLLYSGVISRVNEPALIDRVKETIIQKYAGEPDARSAKAWIFEIREPPDGKSE